MRFPAVFDRVRVSGRDGQFTIVRVDHFGALADVCPAPGGATVIQKNVPFDLLSEWHEVIPILPNINVTRSLWGVRETLATSLVRLASSHHVIADLHSLVTTTHQSIKDTQLRIAESDRLIARSGFTPTAPLPEPD